MPPGLAGADGRNSRPRHGPEYFSRQPHFFLIVKLFEHTYAAAQIRTCLWPQHMSEGEPPGKTPDASKDERLKATT